MYQSKVASAFGKTELPHSPSGTFQDLVFPVHHYAIFKKLLSD